jgi:hypothetical protein
MSISSSATGLRPGVCTSTTRPTTPNRGNLSDFCRHTDVQHEA